MEEIEPQRESCIKSKCTHRFNKEMKREETNVADAKLWRV
jgi:hypothetical protein